MIETVSARRARRLLAERPNLAVIDTRSPGAFEEWHIPGAVNVPYSTGDQLPGSAVSAVAEGHASTVMTVCARGNSSMALAERMAAAGYESLVNLEGGMTAWSSVYDAVEVDLGAGVTCIQLQRVAKGCLGYVVACPATGRAAVIDPPRHVDRVLEVLDDRDLEAVAVLDTHVHADHVSGGPTLAEELAVPYRIGREAIDRGLAHPAEAVSPGERLAVGEVELEAIAAPGHTSEMLSFRIGDRAVITGDTLFVDAVGRTELEDADAAGERAEQLHRTLHEGVLDLPDDTVVLPGHFEPSAETIRSAPAPHLTTVGEARSEVDLLGLDRSTFVERIVDRSATRPPNYETVIAINLGVEPLPDEDALTALELGPNRCAAPAEA